MRGAMSKDERLFDEATDLIIRLQNDPTSTVTLDMVRSWRARSPAHEAAWVEAAEIYGMAGTAIKRARAAERRKRGGPTRRSVILGFGVGAAALAVGREALPWAILQARADHLTGTATISRFTLPDGTRVTLGPDSAVAVDISPEQRRVDLLAGMSYFDVAAHDRVPFEVIADATLASSIAGGFDVSIDDGIVTLGVERGSVKLAVPDSPVPLVETIAAGNWLSITSSDRTMQRGTRDLDQIAAWRDGRIIAENETVASVIARIARWLPGRVVLANPGIGKRRVNGVFDLSRPLSALEAVVHPFGGKVRQLSSLVTVVTPF